MFLSLDLKNIVFLLHFVIHNDWQNDYCFMSHLEYFHIHKGIDIAGEGLLMNRHTFNHSLSEQCYIDKHMYIFYLQLFQATEHLHGHGHAGK